MQKGDELLDYMNKVKIFANQLSYLKIPKRDEWYSVMILLEGLQTLYENLITALEMMPMKELTIKYIIARLMHEMLKRTKKKTEGEDVIIVLRQNKDGN